MPVFQPQPLPTIIAGPLTLRPAATRDADALLSLLAAPEIAEWWGHNDLASITDELQGHFTILINDEVAGLLECHQEPEPTYPSVAFDIFLGVPFHGSGHGRMALRLADEHFIGLGHHRFTIDPAVTNTSAIRCYRAVGFQPVGILRAAERAPDGQWRDALLMDLLPSDLTSP